MKKKNLIMIATSMVFLLSTLFGKEVSNAGDQRVARVAEGLENSSPSISVLNINNLAYWISKDGAYTTSGSPNGEQADYPIFTGGLIYADGMLWGAKVKGDGQGDGVRVGGSTYYHGLKAGRVITDGSGNVLGSDDPANNHVWRVRKDWETGDLTVDAANYYGYTSASDVTAEQIAAVKEQYEYDWNNWPTAWGAPYEDVNMNGSYDVGTDIPGYPKADQTMWTIANDVPKVVNEAGDSLDYQSTAPNLYGADPIGIELQITLWGYAFGAGDPLGNMIFKKATMKYMGLPDTPAGARMDSVYFTQWSDPDLGTYTDDYVGCDIDLSFGYVYNGNRLDGVYNGIHNLPVPAGGYDFLQGPPDTDDIDGDGNTSEYLPMTSFTYFGAGSSISDPDLASYAGSLQFYNLMEGFLPRPEYPTQIPWTDPATGETTKFALSGDPVTGSGWIDGVQLPPGDRRMVMASGPFTMNLGESIDVVIGIVGGMGLDNISSVSVAKFHDQYAQYAYDQNFVLPSSPQSPEVVSTSMTSEIILNWGSNCEAVESPTPSGFEFEGYNVYQLPYNYSSKNEAVRLETFDVINLIQVIIDPIFDLETGLIIDYPVQFGSDLGIQRYYDINWDYINEQPLTYGETYYYAVTAYSFLPDNAGSPFKALESSFVPIAVTFGSSQMDYGADAGEFVPADHEGTSNSVVEVRVISPDQLTGNDYQIYFDQQDYYRDLDGIWQPISTNSTVRGAASTADALDCGGSTITATAFASASLGTIDLVLDFALVCPGGAWIDGMKMTFPAGFAAKVNSWAITGSGNVCSYGAGSGQNCDNLDGTWTGDELLFGDDDRTGFGAFESSNAFTVNYTPDDVGTWDLPVEVGYVIYDDGYDGTTGDGTGITTASTQNYEEKTEIHWNLVNLTTGEIQLEDQTFISGADLYGGMSVGQSSELHYNTAAAVTIDGFQVNVEGGYAAPTDVFGHTYELDEVNAALYGESTYDIDSYAQNGWALTAKAVDTYGNGITSVSILQRDIQVDFCGEFVDDPITVNDVVYYGADLTLPHSYAWISGSRVGNFTDHPAPGGDGNPNDNSGAPFRIAVPFKVYDMEAEGGPVQIDIDLYDRIQSYSAGDTVYAFNPYNRMYTHFIHHEYLDGGQYVDGPSGVPSDFFTWNVVWWDTQFNQGDKVTFNYANPIQPGVDTYSFSTISPVEFAIEKGDVNYDEEINISDVVIFINYLLQITDLETDAQLFAADFNSDYAINISDAVGIINSILGQSARTMASLSNSKSATISLPEEPFISENSIRLPIEITADISLAALQVELNYESEILEPLSPIIAGEEWNGVNVLFHSPTPGKVVYLFYSLNGVEIPIDSPPIFEFRNISDKDKYSTKIKLIEAVFANSSGISAPVEYGNILSKTNLIPETYAIHPNYPNPFNPITYISYDLPKMSVVNIEIFNILGQKVKTLMSRSQMAGHHRVQWNGKNQFDKDLPSGVYLVKFKANHFNHHQKIMLLK